VVLGFAIATPDRLQHSTPFPSVVSWGTGESN